MRKVVMILSVLFTIKSYAQSGTVLLYGSGTLVKDANAIAYGTANTTSWEAAGGVGYQFSEHCTIGFQGSYGHIEDVNDGFFTNSTQVNWAAGGFFRYTKRVGNIFFLYGQASLAYTQSELHYPVINTSGSRFDSSFYYNFQTGTSSTKPPPDPRSHGFIVQAFPAVGATLYRGIAINFSFGGISYSAREQRSGFSDYSKYSLLQITFGQQVNFGISCNFNTHKKGLKK